MSFKGVSGLTAIFVLVPTLIQSCLAVAALLLTESIVEDFQENRAEGLVMASRLKDDRIAMDQAINQVLTSVSGATSTHLAGLTTGKVDLSKKAVGQSAATVEAATAMAAVVRSLLSSPVIKDAAVEGLDRNIGFLLQSSQSIPRYIEFLDESRARTIQVFESEGRAAAVSNYIFEESKRVEILQNLMKRISVTAADVVVRVEGTIAAKVAAETEAGASTLTMFRWGMIAVIVVASFVVLGIALLVSNRRLARPLVDTSTAMVKLSERDYSVDLPPERKDEIGDIVRTLNIFRDVLKQQDDDAAKEREASAAQARRREAVDTITKSFDSSVSGVLAELSGAAKRMSETADSMIASTHKTAERSSTVTNAASETAKNVQTVAAAAEELSVSLDQASAQVASSNAAAQQAVTKIEDASQRVNELYNTAQKIGEVITMISDIAEQTNLLALNATIESARAGEAGKGFAVVANEVKSLANQTATATEDISKQISAMQSATQGAVSSIQEIEATIQDLSSASDEVSSVIQQQSEATAEIARNIQEASVGTNTVSQSASEVDAAAAETGEAAAEVQNVSQQLSSESNTLSDEVRKFLTSIREADSQSGVQAAE